MQYALLIYGSDDRSESLSEEERDAQMKEYMAIGMSPQTRAAPNSTSCRRRRP